MNNSKILILVFSALLIISCSNDFDEMSNDLSSENVLEKSLVLDTLALEQAMTDFARKFNPIKNDLLDLSIDYNNGIISRNEYNDESKRILKPLSNESEQLLSAYGFTEDDYRDMDFDNLSIEKRSGVQTHMAVTAFLIDEGGNLPITGDPGTISNSDPWSGSRVGPCILEALGAEALVDLWQGRALSSFAVRRAIIRSVGKVAARVGLGAIGTALAVADFVWCMGRE